MTGVTKLAGVSKQEEGGGGEEKGNFTMAGQRTANKEKCSFSASNGCWQTEMIIFTNTDMGWCERYYRNQKSINVVVFASPDRCLSPY